jgi:tetrahydromethanopterin S-methyltransferase subunit G
VTPFRRPAVDVKLAGIREVLALHTTRFSKLDARLNDLDRKVDVGLNGLDRKAGVLDGKVNDLDRKVDNIGRKLDEVLQRLPKAP